MSLVYLKLSFSLSSYLQGPGKKIYKIGLEHPDTLDSKEDIARMTRVISKKTTAQTNQREAI